jgi:hypothetical protein
MSSFHNDEVRATYNQLVAAFGEPSDGDGGYKVFREFTFQLHGESIRIYDWKERVDPRDNPDLPFYWHIGASSQMVSHKAKAVAFDRIQY